LTRKILVADGDRRLSQILAGHELVLAHALEEAQRAIERSQFDMIVVTVHFDDSRMFDLLRYLQARGRHGNRPLVCVRSQRFTSPAISIEGLEIATKALGCTLFLDLTWYADDANGRSAVRQLLEHLLSP
jgi:DNA-binding response OmpR family regulator